MPETDTLPQGSVLCLVRSGGLRPSTEKLVLFTDGRGQITRGFKRQTSEREFDAEEVQRLLGALVLAGFFEMAPEVGVQVPDGFAYELSVRSGEGSRTVVTYDGSVPPALTPVLAALRRMLRA
jgi:hypothetical protein